MEEIENILETLLFRDAIQLEMGNDKILPDVVKEAFAAAGKEKFAPDMECCVLHGATSAKLSEKAREELPFLSYCNDRNAD